jgi:hypothetical protein
MSLDQIRWILSGKPLYGAPTPEFLPFAYNPVYFFLSAGVSKIIGIGFLAPRLISIVSTLVTITLIYFLISKETGQPFAGIVSAGLYAACFRFSGAWMDLAKVDSLFLCLLLAAFTLQQNRKDRFSKFVHGSFWLMGYFTKQLALLITGFVACASLFVTRGRTWFYWFCIGIVGGGIFLVSDILSQGWYSFYSVDILRYHRWMPNVGQFWQRLIQIYWPAFLMSGIGLFYLFRRSLLHQRTFELLNFTAALIVASWSVFMKQWTYDNGFLPACLGVSLAAGFSWATIVKATVHRKFAQAILGITCALLVILQYTYLNYDPWKQIPERDNLQNTQQFIDLLRSLPGEVWIFNHGHFGYLSGKPTYLNSVPLGDVLGGLLPPQNTDTYQRRNQVANAYKQIVHGQAVSWVVSDKLTNLPFFPYYLEYQVFSAEEFFFPVTGAMSHPQVILIQNPVAHGGTYPLSEEVYHIHLTGWEFSDPILWAIEPNATFPVALEIGYRYEMSITTATRCQANRPTVQQVNVQWDDHPLGQITFQACESGRLVYDIPAEWVQKQQLSHIGFETDADPSGFGITALTFTQKK